MKRYLTANEYLRDSWRLAERIFASGWRPDVMIALWRGGAPVGVAVHEYLKARGWDIEHEVIKCSSYEGIGKRGKVVVVNSCSCRKDENSILPLQLDTTTKKILFIDDVFDTGKTWEAILNLQPSTFNLQPQPSLKLATVYWKKPCNLTKLRPDYCVHEVGDDWLVFPHEIVGLSDEEVAEKDPLLGRLTRGVEF